MSRINSAIPVRCLTDEHLLVEHREIKRLPYCLNKAIQSGSINHIPEKFTLGKGHVLFFLNKMWFTYIRYHELFSECLVRDFNVENYSKKWSGLKETKYCGNSMYILTSEERKLLIKRITERIMKSSKKVWHYYGKPISKGQAIALLYK